MQNNILNQNGAIVQPKETNGHSVLKSLLELSPDTASELMRRLLSSCATVDDFSNIVISQDKKFFECINIELLALKSDWAMTYYSCQDDGSGVLYTIAKDIAILCQMVEKCNADIDLNSYDKIQKLTAEVREVLS